MTDDVEKTRVDLPESWERRINRVEAMVVEQSTCPCAWVMGYDGSKVKEKHGLPDLPEPDWCPDSVEHGPIVDCPMFDKKHLCWMRWHKMRNIPWDPVIHRDPPILRD